MLTYRAGGEWARGPGSSDTEFARTMYALGATEVAETARHANRVKVANADALARRVADHTFASQWVLGGGSLATLARILGHASVTITERHYVHLRPDAFAERDLGTITLDLRPGSGVALDRDVSEA